jgi:hypothetical protein
MPRPVAVELKSVVVKRYSSGVLWARCAIAAVTMSPPQVSSIVVAMPRSTHKSRASLSFRESTKLADLQIHDIHSVIGISADQGADVANRLVEHKRVGTESSEGSCLSGESAYCTNLQRFVRANHGQARM